MPYTRSKNKLRKTKSKKIKVLKQTKLMKTRLMAISLKVDDYIYKKKPISAHEANTYARELDALRNQCSDERYLQVIEKLTSYMKCLIEEQKDISDPIRNTTEEFNAINVQDNHNAIVDIEMEKALSNLSIAADPKDPIDITDKNDDECYQKKLKIVNSTSTVTKENSSENNTKKENSSNEIDASQLKAIDRKQIDIADDINENSQNILSNFEYKNYISLGTLRNYRKINNKQKQETIEDATNKTTVYDTTEIDNNTNKPDINNLNDKHQKEKDTDRDSILSANLLGNFEYGNLSAAHQKNINPINYQPRNDNEVTANIIAETRNIVNNYNIMNTENTNTKLNINNINVIKEKVGDSNKLSQNLLINFESKNYATAGTLQNNTNSKSYQSQQNIGSYCTSKDYTISKTNQIQYHLPQPNLTAFMPSILKRTTLNTIEPSKKDQQNNLIHNPSQNEMHIIDKVKKQRNPRKDTVKTKIKRKVNTKNKVTNVNVTIEQNDLSKQTVNTYFHEAKNPENLVINSAKKNKSKLLKKKREEIDMSWVENMKFVRVIEREEYIEVDDLEESFWSDLTVPLNISITDFECDNINIWKN